MSQGTQERVVTMECRPNIPWILAELMLWSSQPKQKKKNKQPKNRRNQLIFAKYKNSVCKALVHSSGLKTINWGGGVRRDSPTVKNMAVFAENPNSVPITCLAPHSCLSTMVEATHRVPCLTSAQDKGEDSPAWFCSSQAIFPWDMEEESQSHTF